MPSPRLRRTIRISWIAGGLAFSTWMVLGFQAIRGVSIAGTPHRWGWEYVGSGTSAAGVIFLPGGMVDPAAYAPLLHEIARAGYTSRLVKLPWRCACTDGQERELFATVKSMLRNRKERWVLAGHSRGAMLAAKFVRDHTPPGLAGVALIGTTHPRDFSLAHLEIPVTKIYGTRDGIAPYAAMQANASLLPVQTRWVGIEGGNHVQFGWYRHQLGDNAATISRQAQQQALRNALLQLLKNLEAPSSSDAVHAPPA